jgi:hypothetical protein
MLFMYIHTHSPESCKIDNPEFTQKMARELMELAAKSGIKWVASYTAVQEHTIYSVYEANDMAGLQSLLAYRPGIQWGTGRLVPVVSPPALSAQK